MQVTANGASGGAGTGAAGVVCAAASATSMPAAPAVPTSDHELAQPGAAQAFDELVHKLARLIGNVAAHPIERQKRLLAAHLGQESARLAHSAGPGEAGAAQALGALESRPQAQRLGREVRRPV